MLVPSGVAGSPKNVLQQAALMPHGGLPCASGGGGVYGGNPPPGGDEGAVPVEVTTAVAGFAGVDGDGLVVVLGGPHDASTTVMAPAITALSSVLCTEQKIAPSLGQWTHLALQRL